MLLNGQALESFDRSFRGVLRLQVCLQNVEVIVKPLQVLLLDSANPLQHFGRVKGGSGVVNGLELLAGALLST